MKHFDMTPGVYTAYTQRLDTKYDILCTCPSEHVKIDEDYTTVLLLWEKTAHSLHIFTLRRWQQLSLLL